MNTVFVREKKKLFSFLGLVINCDAEAKRKSVGAIAEKVEETIEIGFLTPSGPTLSRIIILLKKYFSCYLE